LVIRESGYKGAGKQNIREYGGQRTEGRGKKEENSGRD
jgi:hypothetical protein